MNLVGRQIGRYRILEQLGQGGMSVVYKGLDTALDREVAVKVLHPHLAIKPESRKRLEREAKAVARLHHPNILEVFDYAGSDAQDAYIVTEYIRGKTLRQFLAEESLQPPEIAVMVMHEIASALAHAHDQGVLHRDLKPENVMVREDGVLKLTDFGIAKILDRDEKMTQTGALVGSPAHMAPEIIEGEESGAEADVFSLGTMLYLFVAGKLPFTAPNTTATLKRILDCVYDDPRQLVPTVSDELADVIATCLKRKPQERYPAAGKLRDALAHYLTTMGLTRPHEELPKFFLDPQGYRQSLVPRLTQTLLARAQVLIDEKRAAKALSALNLVLAYDPKNDAASALLSQLRAKKQREQRTRKLVRGAGAITSLVIATAAGLWGYRAMTAPPPFEAPLVFAPHQIALATVTWPKPEVVVAPSPPEPIPTSALPDAGLPRAPVQSARPSPGLRPDPVKAPSPTVAVVAPNPAVIAPQLPTPSVEATTAPGTLRVNVRPFGYVTIDEGPRSAAALQTHVLTVPSGPHRVTISCELCEPTVRQITVRPGENPPLNVAAQLKPAFVSFAGYPANAQVRVGAEERTVAATKDSPFRIGTPPEGSKEMRLTVVYEVTVDGQPIDRGTRTVPPGEATTLTKAGP